MPDAVPQQSGAEHGKVGTDHQQFDDILWTVHAAGGGQVGSDAAVKDADPSQWKPQRLRSTEQHIGLDLQLIEVNVGLIEAVEQHQSVRARFVELLRHIGHIAEERAELDGYRNANRNLYFPENVNVGFLNLGTGDVRTCRNVVDIALNGIGPGLLNQLGKLRPTAECGAVQAGNNRNLHRLLSFADVIQISLGSQVEFSRLREKRSGFCEAVRAFRQMMFQFEAFLPQLLLEQRVQDYGGCACVFEVADAVNLLRKRRCGSDQRCAKRQTQVSGA